MTRDDASVLGEWESRREQAIVQSIEAAIEVRRRYQFFVWTQGSVQQILPHKLAVCGVYERARKQVRLEVFNSILIPPPVLSLLADGQSPLMQHVFNGWINNRGRPLVVQLAGLGGRALSNACDSLLAEGFNELLVHGVSRPQRASEIETLFVFASPGAPVVNGQVGSIELLMPHLHSTYLRVQLHERESGDVQNRLGMVTGGYTSTSISSREEQVLCWVREGMSNLEIGAQLGISPLTVKNHVQKILRKLGASNRAQAVARAMSMNLLKRAAGDSESALK
jgi:transcriptional regulator EpsA